MTVPLPQVSSIQCRVPDVFHIGFPRTGTTFLQKGIWSQLSNQIFCTKSRVGEIYRANSAAELAGLYDDVPAGSFGNRVFLDTEEEFSGDLFNDYLDVPEKIASINANAKIIVCLRSQATITPSLYYLFIKKGNTLTYPDYVRLLTKNRKFDYLPLLNRYWKFFGKENVLVLMFEDLHRSKGKFVHDVLSFMNIDQSVNIDTDPRVNNASPSPLHTRVLRVINSLTGTTSPTRYMPENERARVIQRLHLRTRLSTIPFFFANKISTYLPNGWFALPVSKMAALINQTYAESNKELFQALDKDIEAYEYPGSN